MRSILIAFSVLALNLSGALGADKSASQAAALPATSITIEARIISMRPEIEQVLKAIDPGMGIFVPPAPKPELQFSSPQPKSRGGSDIQLISAASVVEEQPPVHVMKLSSQQRSEILRVVERMSPNHVLAQAPKITVADNTIGEIADTSQQRKGVSVDFETGKTIVDEYDEGTTLLARPHVNKSGSIDLDLLMRAQNVQKVNLYDHKNVQVQSPKLAKAQVELSATLKSGESLVFWYCSEATSEPATPSKRLAKTFSRKAPEQPYQSQLTYIVTPTFSNEQGLSAEGQ